MIKIITEFRGRGDEIRVYPLSFSEFYNAYKDKKKALQDYMTYISDGYTDVNRNTINSYINYLLDAF